MCNLYKCLTLHNTSGETHWYKIHGDMQVLQCYIKQLYVAKIVTVYNFAYKYNRCAK